MEGERVTETHEAMLTRALVLLGEQNIHIQNLTTQITKLNNRTGKLEDWKAIMQIADAKAKGIVEGRTGLQRTQLGILVGIVSASGSIAGVIINKVMAG